MTRRSQVENAELKANAIKWATACDRWPLFDIFKINRLRNIQVTVRQEFYDSIATIYEFYIFLPEKAALARVLCGAAK